MNRDYDQRRRWVSKAHHADEVVGAHADQWPVNGLHTLPIYCGMVVGSKAEDELLSMTRGQVETELLKPAHRRFSEFNTHLAETEAEWAAMEKQLLKLETWPRDKRECFT